jgi:hypothetical protein
VADLEGEYEGNWARVTDEMDGINRMDKDWFVATARVHVVVSDRSVWDIGERAFTESSNLVKVTAPFVEEVGERAFYGAYNLCHVFFSLGVVVKLMAFI